MADSTQIDELRIDISVNDKSNGESSSKKVRALASAISRLNDVVRSADLKGLQSYFSGLTKGIKPLAKELKGVSKELLAFSKVAGKIQRDTVGGIKIGTTTSKTKGYDGSSTYNLQGGGAAQAVTEQVNVDELRNLTAKQVLQKELQIVQAKLKNATTEKEILELRKKELSLTKQIETSETRGKGKSLLGSFAKTFGRIAMYRAIRTIIKDIAQAMQEGVQNYAQYSESANKAISSINNSIAQVKNTFGVTLGYLLEALEPIIVSISDAIVDVINNLNMAIASFKGEETFSKAKKATDDYADSLKKTANLFSFDKFNVISGSKEKNPAEMFEEMEVPDALPETASEFKTILETIQKIINIAKTIWNVLKPVLQPLFSLIVSILDVVGDILEILTPIIQSVAEVARGIVEQFSGAFDIITGLLKILTGDFEGAWEKIKQGFEKMGKGIVNMFIGFLNIIIDAINFMFVKLNPITWLAKLFGADTSNWGFGHIDTLAGGGIVPNTGTLFIAGEAGTEAVYRTSAGQTGVANVEQMQQAFAGALDQRTNVLLSAIYNSLGMGNDTARGGDLTSFVNVLMPEIDAYNLRRGRA